MNSYQKISSPDVSTLVKENYHLVKKIAWHLHGRVQAIIEIEDLIQIGMLGLISAAQNYKPQKDATFSSYANFRIKGEILDYLRKNSNLCRATIKMKQISDKAEASLKQKLGREPNSYEMSKELGITNEKYLEWESAFQANTIKNLEDSYDEFSQWFVSKETSPEEYVNDSQLRDHLKQALRQLDQKESLVIQLYFVEELNIYEISEVLEVSTGRISQIKTNAIKKVRSMIKNKLDQ